MKNITQEVSTELDGLRVYPVIGNHDTYPQDIFYNFAPRDNPAVKEWAPEWLQFIPSDDQQKTFLDYGYYSMPLENHAGEKLGNANTKVIVMNTNVCYGFNWNAFMHFQDPGNELNWLEQELEEIERNNATAIILGHVPNLDECERQFGKRWHALMDRF